MQEIKQEKIEEIVCKHKSEHDGYEFYKKHYLNPYSHTMNTIKKEGGAVFTEKSRVISNLFGELLFKMQKINY